ncbi:helix-turn-helix transcriptional regulator [Clostridium sp. DMHC 10]|uniref:helix-turn-helix domain-containing protein n=1 Tax=Clostridium sp. DMHC 10 TaxID=747377 RepID=UPI000A042A98|nr:helix-turn-helix transcriptional regulator [Clostridium sp. DMHC 10]
MSYCTILSKGDKIKLLRKKYKLRQEDIAGNDITRNLISEIETNKANLTRSTAEAILKNLQKLGTKNHFEIEETVDYLLEDETIQASRVLDDYVGKLKTFMVYRDGDFTATLKEVEEFLVKWSITDKKIIIYELAGDYFGTQNEIDKSIIYYEKALTLVGKLSLSPMLLSILKNYQKYMVVQVSIMKV